MTKRLLLLCTLVCILFTAAAAYAEEVSATPLTLGEAAEAVIENAGDYAYFSFTPAETGSYVWYSTADSDTYGYLYDSNMNQLAYNDDGGTNNNFKIQYTLTAGNTYYFGARYYNTSSTTGSFSVILDGYHGLTKAEAAEAYPSVLPNSTATLEVVAETTDGAITYQWYKEDTGIIEGATASTYTTDAIASRTDYYCVVSDQYGNSRDVYFYIRIDNQFTARRVGEQTRYISPNAAATLQVAASCTDGELTYQWYNSNGYAVEGANSDTYTTEAITSRTSYYCRIYDQYGNSENIWFYINIDNRLVVSRVGDEHIYVSPNATATLQITASCLNGGLTYRWYGDGTPAIEGATTDTYTTDPITSYTYYCCYVYDEYGNSRDVGFYIGVDNQFTAERIGNETIYVAPNAAVTLQVNASCQNGELSYQWYNDNYDSIAGATSNSYTTGAITSRTSYYCRVADQYGNSSEVWFYIGIDNQFTASRVGNQDVYVLPNSSTTLKVNASCADGDLTYQWYKSGFGAIEGATSNTYTTEVITSHTGYYCRVSDQYENYQNIWFYVSVDNQLTIRPVGNENINVSPNSTANLQVTASCQTGTLTYAWYRYLHNDAEDYWYNRTQIASASSDSLTTEPITEYCAYSCVVTDQYGNEEDVWFTIGIDNQLTISAIGEAEFSILPGGSVDMAVIASCANGALTYQWYKKLYSDLNSWSWNKINNATSTAFSSGALSTHAEYRCTVTDTYSNSRSIDFIVNIENGLKAVATDQFQQVKLGEDVTLEVEAICRSGNLTYTWYNEGNQVTSAKSEVYTLQNVTTRAYIECYVTDEYGNRVQCWFDVEVDNGLNVTPVLTVDGTTTEYPDERLTVDHGADIILTFNAACDHGSIRYDWSESSSNVVIDSNNRNTCRVTDIDKYTTIICTVSDDYDNRYWYYYYITVDNDFTAEPVGETMKKVAVGDTVVLAVNASAASGAINYTWKKNSSQLPEETGPSITFTAKEAASYTCTATDQYGTSITNEFNVFVGDIPALALDETVSLSLLQGEKRYYSYTPSETGTYVLSSSGSSDTYVYLYNASLQSLASNDDGGTNMNFSLAYVLTSGTKYIYRVQGYGGNSATFSMKLIKQQETSDVPAGAYVLRKGQTARLPFTNTTSITSSNTGVVTVSGTSVTAKGVGTATIAVEWKTGTKRNYTICVRSGSVLSMPGALKTIQSEAFANDDSVLFVSLSASTKTVAKFAFSESGLLQITVPAADTTFATSAFYSITPTILCKEGSTAAAFAQNQGYKYLYID